LKITCISLRSICYRSTHRRRECCRY